MGTPVAFNAMTSADKKDIGFWLLATAVIAGLVLATLANL